MPRYVLDTPEGFVRLDVAPTDAGWRWVRLDTDGLPDSEPVTGFAAVTEALKDAAQAHDAEGWAEETASE